MYVIFLTSVKFRIHYLNRAADTVLQVRETSSVSTVDKRPGYRKNKNTTYRNSR